MENKKSNRSLFLYTSLIFLAAIAVIAFSFFAQINTNKNHEKYLGDEDSETSISGKTAQLSEENRILLETIGSLNEKNSELSEDNEILTEKVLTFDKQMENAKKLYVVFDFIKNSEYEKAVTEYETLEPLFFTEEQDKFYGYITEELKDYLPKEETQAEGDK